MLMMVLPIIRWPFRGSFGRIVSALSCRRMKVLLNPSEWLLRKMGQNLYMQTATWLVARLEVLLDKGSLWFWRSVVDNCC